MQADELILCNLQALDAIDQERSNKCVGDVCIERCCLCELIEEVRAWHWMLSGQDSPVADDFRDANL